MRNGPRYADNKDGDTGGVLTYTVPGAAHVSEKYLRVFMGASPLAGKFPKAV
jgi:hypothetical protein